ncbi:MAG: hypothetical protein KJ622_15620 [Alphaproteobacteria bacterium]|nr:hypothetical protein [Alphaproteobacteria bacterium]
MLLLAAIATAIVGLFDHEERQSIAQLAGKDVPAAAGRLARKYPLRPENCPDAWQLDEYHLLAGALAAVERLNTSIIEHAVEAAVVRAAVLAGLPVPDFSIGPGQIRPSTAAAAVRKIGSAEPEATQLATGRPQIALELLSECASLDWGVAVLKMLSPPRLAAAGEFSREAVMDLAGKYNSQFTAASNEAVVANYLYRELTYQVFQEYKFLLRP